MSIGSAPTALTGLRVIQKPTINVMNSILYIIGAIVVIVVILKVLGLY